MLRRAFRLRAARNIQRRLARSHGGSLLARRRLGWRARSALTLRDASASSRCQTAQGNVARTISLAFLVGAAQVRSGNPTLALQITATLPGSQFVMGFLRLGAVVDLISHPVISGFTSATAIIIGELGACALVLVFPPTTLLRLLQRLQLAHSNASDARVLTMSCAALNQVPHLLGITARRDFIEFAPCFDFPTLS